MSAPLQLLWFGLHATSAQTAAWRAWLSPHELERADRYVRPEHGQRYVAAHAHLRWALAQRLGCGPAEVAFRRGPHGKPHLAGGGPQFNLTHSGEIGMLALHPVIELGVDVESADRRRDWLGIAGRFYTAREAGWLRGLPAADVPLAFCRLWTVKEAWMKALGRGLAAGAANLEVALGDGAPAATEPAAGRTWWARELAIAPGYAAAVVCAGDPRCEPRLTRQVLD